MLSTAEQERVLAIIAEHNQGASSLVQVLTIIQEELGYLPQSVQQTVAEAMQVPLSRVYEVTTFYTRFSAEKKGRYEISVCMGTACYIKGAGDVLAEIKTQLHITEGQTTADGLFTLGVSRCIGACALAPAITINKEVFGMMNRQKVQEVLQQYSADGGVSDERL